MNPHWPNVSFVWNSVNSLWILWILTAPLWVHKEFCPVCSASYSTNATGRLRIVSSHPFFCPISCFAALGHSLSTIKSLWSHPGCPSWTDFTDHSPKSPPVGDNSLNTTIPYKPCKKGFGNNRKCLCREQQRCFNFSIIFYLTMSCGRN